MARLQLYPLSTRFRPTAIYCVMVLSTVGLFFLVRHYGELLLPPPAHQPAPLSRADASPQLDVLWHILLVLVVVIVTGRAIGRVFLFLQQPPVIGEVVAGILLGEFKVPWCRLRINKQGAVRGVRDVGIVIERGSRVQ